MKIGGKESLVEVIFLLLAKEGKKQLSNQPQRTRNFSVSAMNLECP